MIGPRQPGRERGRSSNVSGMKAYWKDTSDMRASLLMVIPLFLTYQIGLLASPMSNGADFVTTRLLALLGHNLFYYLLFNLAVLAGLVAAARYAKGTRARLRHLPGLLFESLVYSIFFAQGVHLLARLVGLGWVLAVGGAVTQLVPIIAMSAGAGLYEELVFRVGLMGGLAWLGRRRLPEGVSLGLAVIFSSLIFSGVHHLGALGDPFQINVFLFRFLSGVLFCALYRTRGLAVAAYTHCFYDIQAMWAHGGL